MKKNMRKEIFRRFILENFLFTDDESELNDDDSFMENQVIDSTGILEVIEFLEEEWNVKTEDDEMIPENLDSVNKVMIFVERKQG
jgi:acyl carrier protein